MLNKVHEKNPKIPLLHRYRYHSGGIEVKLLGTARFLQRTVTVPALYYSRNKAVHLLFVNKVNLWISFSVLSTDISFLGLKFGFFLYSFLDASTSTVGH